MRGRPTAAIDEIGFRPRLAIDRSRRKYRDGRRSLRGITRSWIHKMGESPPLSPKELFLAAGSGQRSVLQENRGRLLVRVMSIANRNPPAIISFRSRSHSITYSVP